MAYFQHPSEASAQASISLNESHASEAYVLQEIPSLRIEASDKERLEPNDTIGYVKTVNRSPRCLDTKPQS